MPNAAEKDGESALAQWKRARPITLRYQDRYLEALSFSSSHFRLVFSFTSPFAALLFSRQLVHPPPPLPPASASASASRAQIERAKSEMLDLVNTRKAAEADVQLLANRLAHLRAEEQKALKRAEETRKRAEEVRSLKATHAAKVEAKRKAEAEREAHLRAQQERLRQHRETRRSSLHGFLHGTVKGKAQEAEALRQDKKERDAALSQELERRAALNRQRAEQQRRAELEAKAKREREEVG
jgi:hypothetical protein